MKNMRKKKQTDKLQRMYTIAKGFLLVTPLLCYLYISLLATSLQMSFQDILLTQPSLTIVFLIAMVNPYIAYLLNLIQKKLAQGDVAFVLINMGLLLIAQALTMNVFYFIMLLYVFYKTIVMHHLSIKLSHCIFPIKQLFYKGGGSCFVIMISTICLFASLQVM